MIEKFNWVKKGLVYDPQMPGYTHGSHPCIQHLEGNNYIMAYTVRDGERKSHICLVNCIIEDEEIIFHGETKIALHPGKIGYFDCDGTISVCFVESNNKLYLYYVGWQNLPNDMWLCDTGRVNVNANELTLEREFEGPVLGRDKNNPLFAAATAFLIIDGIWHTWYNSGVKWVETPNGLKHYYGIHHATSLDGVDWMCDKGMCIPFADEFEYAFGRPSVICIKGIYCMWFAHRATKEIDTYRMGFAYSNDGISWVRDDSMAGIDVSEEGWDSEMICYPYVFKHKDNYYMLYNGNNYGRTGFGLAIMEESL